MRIISGLYKGRRIIAPKHLPVRPTTDMAKEALFNILNHQIYFEDISVLDLFAGTGNISYEFASRGTSDITSVDNYYGCIQFIKRTSEDFELGINTIKSDVYKFLETTHKKFDVIFADPPYDMAFEEFKKLVEIVFTRSVLSEEGMLIVEHSKHTDLSDLEYFYQQKRYGGNCFSFFRTIKKADL